MFVFTTLLPALYLLRRLKTPICYEEMTSLTISEVSQISKHLEKMIEIEGEKLNN